MSLSHSLFSAALTKGMWALSDSTLTRWAQSVHTNASSDMNNCAAPFPMIFHVALRL